MLELEPLMTLRGELRQPPTDVGATPSGTRQIHDLVGGRFEGPKLRGTVLPSGGDWLLVGADGVGRLDVRATLETEDGARIYVQYPGVSVANFTARYSMNGWLGCTRGSDVPPSRSSGVSQRSAKVSGLRSARKPCCSCGHFSW